MRLHQQRSRFIANAYGSELSLNEAYLIIEFDSDPQVTLTNLRSMLGLERSVVSRSVERLRRRGYLRAARNSVDRRKRVFEVTAKGRAFLKLHDQKNNSFVAEHVARLSMSEVAELQRYQHLISDSVGASPVRLRPSEHPFTIGIRRITRGLGFNGSSLFQSGHSSTVWQVLAAIAYSTTGRQLSSLSILLGMNLSTLSQWISRYVREGLIAQSRSAVDGRARELSLTEAGASTLRHIESCGERLLERAFASQPPEAPDRFVTILGKHLGTAVSEPGALLRAELRVEQITSVEARQEARGFLIFHLTRTLRYLAAPEILVGAQHRTYVLREGSGIAAVCEIIPGGDRIVVTNFACNEALEGEATLAEFILTILAESNRKNQGHSLLFSPGMLPLRTQGMLPHYTLASGAIAVITSG
jgi:DNA-binding MarR family transcriptional regulator